MLHRLRAEAVAWIGVLGSAITLLGNVEPLFQLAGWCRLVVENWRAWTDAIWQWLFAAFQLSVPAFVRPALTSTVFIVVIAMGLRLAAWARGESAQLHKEQDPERYQTAAIQDIVRSHAYGSPEYSLAIDALEKELKCLVAANATERSAIWMNPIVQMYTVMCIAGLYKSGTEFNAGASAFAVGCITSLLLALRIAPIRRLNARARWVLVGAVMLLALNYLSLYGQGLFTALRPSSGG